MKQLSNIQGCALAEPGGPWRLTIALGRLENLRFFIQITCWAPWILQFQSTGLPSIFLREQPWISYLLLSYLNTLIVGLAEIHLLLWILVLNFLHKPGAAVVQKVGPGEWDDRWTCMVLLAATVSSSSSLFFLTNTITVQMTDLLRNWQWWIWEIHLKQRNNITQLLYGYKGTHTLISC